MQGAEPFAVLYDEAGHAPHGPPCGPVYPALHRQLVLALLAGGLALKAGHAPPQASSPRSGLNVLAGHGVQAPDTSVYPASHTHASALALATAAVVSRVPHAWHAAEPAAALYVPTVQAWQLPETEV